MWSEQNNEKTKNDNPSHLEDAPKIGRVDKERIRKAWNEHEPDNELHID